MAQIVHDLAPGATIDFATAFTGEIGFAANIRALAAAGAKVIADDVVYFQEPFFQDGPVAVAVGEAAAAGVSYFSAAGNDNLIDCRRARHRLLGSAGIPRLGRMPASAGRTLRRNRSGRSGRRGPNAPGPAPQSLHGLQPQSGARRQPSGSRSKPASELAVDLQWAEPWNGVGTDLDAFLLDDEGKLAQCRRHCGRRR